MGRSQPKDQNGKTKKKRQKPNQMKQKQKQKHKKQKQKQEQKKRRKPNRKRQGPRLPKHDNYIWQLLNCGIADVEQHLRTPWAKLRLQHLRNVVRQKNIADYIKWCDIVSLTNLNTIYNTPESLDELRALRFLTFAEKYNFQLSPFDQLQAATESFFKYEDLCRKTNSLTIFDELDSEEETSSTIDDVLTWPVLRYAREFIQNVIGSDPNIALLDATRHGPGSTALKRGNSAIPIAKYEPPIDVTPSARDIFIETLVRDERWGRSLYYYINRQRRAHSKDTVPHQLAIPSVDIDECVVDLEFSRILFVPKNAKTFRTIAAEPTGNVYCQLAVDDHFRRRLKRWGIDLNTQVKNQELAGRGSTSGRLCTLDLSGASDTIALAWLKLLPPRWALLLMKLRTPKGIMPDGTRVHFQKVSSMGNGFTFVLETLIFASLIYGLARLKGRRWKALLPDIAVFGDDIIVPEEYYSDLVWCLRRSGFVINRTKSFSTGPIRESCGADWYMGNTITRPTFKRQPTKTWELVRDHNLLFLLQDSWPGFYFPETMGRIRSWIGRPSWGPPSEDVIAYLFTRYIPYKRNSTCKQAIDWQCPVYVIRKTELRYKTLKKTSKRRLELSSMEPMMFLNTPNGQPPWWEATTFDISSRKKPADNSDDLYFNRKILRAITSKAVVPYYVWETLTPVRPSRMITILSDH